MTSSQFQVTTATLRTVAGTLGDRAEDSRQLAEKAKDADVDTKSWGLLGLGLGLYSNYTSARDTADKSITEVTAFLTDAQAALQSTARDYDAADQAGGQLFGDIGSAMDGGA
jgi:Excreted virulence factor EspC, type VII ESX diderm